MSDLSTKYLGLTLASPIIAGSSGLTNSVKDIKELEQNGAGAVVLKSLFEEQIMLEADYRLKKAREDGLMYADYSETLDYIDLHVKEKELNSYLELVRNASREVHIPIIASINCVSSMEWTSFAKKIEGAGAKALELNIFVMPFNSEKSCNENEQLTYNILDKVKQVIDIPVSVKISPYFSNLGHVIKGLEDHKASGVVLFNRFASPDIDIKNMKVTVGDKLSTSHDMANSLRWIAIMSNRVKFDLAASTGVHNGEAVVKQLLAGAAVIQITSAIYKHGPKVLVEINKFLNDWMEERGYNYIDQFRGKLSQASTQNPDAYERLQFMKYFSEIK